MANLEHRVSRLEEQAGILGVIKPLVWIIELVRAKDGRPVPPGEFLGARVRDEEFLLPGGESEEAFIARIKAEQLAKVKDQRHPVVVMTLIRSDEASEDAKS